jgi:ferric-dicitrate binding protein FerR (iron transport regulator)
MMDANPQAAAEQARAANRKMTDQLGHLGLDTAISEGVRDLAEKTVAHTREAYDRSMDAFEASVATFERSFEAAGQGAAAFNRKIIDIAKLNSNSSLIPLLRFLAIVLFVASPLGSVAAESVGTVTKVQGSTTPAANGTPVHMNDRLRTGANARLEVTFNDNSKLTLGENANVVIDRYVYNPNKSSAHVVLSATQGALRFAGGKIEQMNQKNIVVNTPSAALAVRGTHFWAGPIDGKYGVYLLNGKVGVSNRAGAVTLARPGMGTDIPLRRAKRQARR